MEFLNNQWTIGIGGGIFSGIIVTLISRFLFNKKDNKEYNQNVRSANNEVIYALRPTISENYFPETNIILALIEANSRKFKVNSKDMYTMKQIAQEMTKEIMDTSFISYQKKDELFNHLIPLYSYNQVEELKEDFNSRVEFSDYRRRLINLTTVLMGVLTSILTIFVVLFPEFDNIWWGVNHLSSGTTYDRYFFSLILALMLTIMPVMLYTTKKIISREKSKLKNQTSDNESKI